MALVRLVNGLRRNVCVGDDLSLLELKLRSTTYQLLPALIFEKSTSRIVHELRPNKTKATDGIKIFKMGRDHES